jgi:hypothetical protein
MRSRLRPVDAPVLACWAMVRKSFSTSADAAASVVRRATAIALIGRPSATSFSSSSSRASSSPLFDNGRVSRLTMVGSMTDPPEATSNTARAS